MSSTHVHLTIEWYMPIDQARPTTLALHSVAAETRMTHGCVRCSVAADFAHHGTVRYTEEWLTEQDLRVHMQSDTFSQLMRLIDGATEPPFIEFALPHQTRGLDFVAEVLASAR